MVQIEFVYPGLPEHPHPQNLVALGLQSNPTHPKCGLSFLLGASPLKYRRSRAPVRFHLVWLLLLAWLHPFSKTCLRGFTAKEPFRLTPYFSVQSIRFHGGLRCTPILNSYVFPARNFRAPDQVRLQADTRS